MPSSSKREGRILFKKWCRSKGFRVGSSVKLEVKKIQKGGLKVENFWIELKETQSGHQILSCQIEGKHWRGFLEVREGKGENGETYTFKSANMRPCNWERCSICHPEVIIT